MALGAFVAASLCGQSDAPRPAFEIADVHASSPATNPDTFVSGGILPGGRYDLRRATMADLIGIAWGTDPDKVFGGPGWLVFDRFDVAAKAPPSTRPETINLMLQSLLADRFSLVLHKDTRPLPGYALSRGSGQPKLKPAEGSGAPACQAQRSAGTDAYAIFSCRNMTMDAFASALRRIAGDYLHDPVVNATGIEGAWDFDLKWNPRSRMPEAGTSRTTIFDAIDKQLGLKLDLQQVPAPVLVVDRVNQKPTPNPSGVEKVLPPRSLEFEVATVKPSQPEERLSYRRYPGGRVEIHAFPMRMLIATAWDVDWDHMDERISGAPKWIDSRRFDIVANASSAAGVPQGSGFLDADFELMLRSLLTDRFALKMHFEDRPVSAYALTALKPKLTKADPSNRAGCKEAGVMDHDPRDINPVLSRLIQCRNMTMAQFAQQLQSLDRVEAAFNDVSDETGLTGAWDFTISFTPRSLLQSSGAPDGASAASEPNGALSFGDAISRQLGLKLEMRKRPMPVLVVDHIDEKPADN